MRERISINDPQAIPKLTERLEELDRRHRMMLMANKILRSNREHKVDPLIERGFTLNEALEMVDTGRGFDVKELRKSHTMRDQVRKRIAEIRRARSRGPDSWEVVPGITYFEDPKQMRLGFRFADAAIPRKVSAYLTERGFWYSMRRGSFERHLTGAGKSAAANARLFLRRFSTQGEQK